MGFYMHVHTHVLTQKHTCVFRGFYTQRFGMPSPPQKMFKEAMIFVSMKNGEEMLADWKRSQWELSEIHMREDQGEKSIVQVIFREENYESPSPPFLILPYTDHSFLLL